MLHHLVHALKEWEVAVDALIDGDMIILLRKGGIRETSREFALAAHRILLYPTVEHQKPGWLKVQYADRVQPVVSGWHPAQISIRAWADITHVFPVIEQAVLEQLLPHHIWNQDFASARWRWKPHTPLLVLCLRVSQLPQPKIIQYRSEYGGCRSWLELVEPVEIADAVPVLSSAKYAEQVRAIRAICEC